MLVIHEDGTGTWFSDGTLYVILAKGPEEEEIYDLLANMFDGDSESEEKLQRYIDEGKLRVLSPSEVREALARYLGIE